jgi:hypothetical protein
MRGLHRSHPRLTAAPNGGSTRVPPYRALPSVLTSYRTRLAQGPGSMSGQAFPVSTADVASYERRARTWRKQRDPVPLVGGAGVAYLPNPLDEESGVRQGFGVGLDRAVLGVERHGVAIPLTGVGEGPALEP